MSSSVPAKNPRLSSAELAMRNQEIVRRYKTGESLKVIARQLGITAERCRQVLITMGEARRGSRPRKDVAP